MLCDSSHLRGMRHAVPDALLKVSLIKFTVCVIELYPDQCSQHCDMEVLHICNELLCTATHHSTLGVFDDSEVMRYRDQMVFTPRRGCEHHMRVRS